MKNISKEIFEEAKTFTLRFPTENQVPKELLRHFIRGYFDGDGCVSFYTNRKTVMVNFVLALNCSCHFITSIFLLNIHT